MKDGRAELPCDIQPPDSNDKVPTPIMSAILLVLRVKDCYEIYACTMMHNNLLLTSPTMVVWIQVHLVPLEKGVDGDDDDDFGDADDDV